MEVQALVGIYRALLRLMDKILHDPKDPKLWELWYIPYNGSCARCSWVICDGTIFLQFRSPSVDGQNPALPIVRNIP